jgi:xanthine/CO dehydrogenase XdhC/CoxF family maturation factor
MQSLDLDVLQRALEWRRAGRRVWLLTVAQTFGASPRPPGSLAAVRDDGILVGSVSGGCIEGAVVKEAREIMDGAPARLLEFGVSNEQAWEVGLACGGRVQVYVEAVQ